MVKIISLTKGASTMIDDVDYPLIVSLRWCLASNGYAVHYHWHDGWVENIFMHRYLMQPPPGMEVDHIDGNRLNNVRSNLRFATHGQNQANRRRMKHNRSGYKGVSFNQGKYEARIQSEGRVVYLGRYETALEAARVYDAAAIQLHGVFAALNFPDEDMPEHSSRS